jgi:hypothetical protein
MAGAGLDPVPPPVAGDVHAPPGWRRWAVCRLAVGASDADEAKATAFCRVERLGVMGQGHGGCAAACLAWATAAATLGPAAWITTGAWTLPQA